MGEREPLNEVWLDENPEHPSEEDSWFIKGPPPIHRIFLNGKVWQRPYFPSPGEEEKGGSSA
jgi:hypothetical protein